VCSMCAPRYCIGELLVLCKWRYIVYGSMYPLLFVNSSGCVHNVLSCLFTLLDVLRSRQVYGETLCIDTIVELRSRFESEID
jgi:hypothetical protein